MKMNSYWSIVIDYITIVFEITGNKGLISVDRNTRLLYHLQYPVPIKSSTKDFKASKIWNYNVTHSHTEPWVCSMPAYAISMIRDLSVYPYTSKFAGDYRRA